MGGLRSMFHQCVGPDPVNGHYPFKKDPEEPAYADIEYRDIVDLYCLHAAIERGLEKRELIKNKKKEQRPEDKGNHISGLPSCPGTKKPVHPDDIDRDDALKPYPQRAEEVPTPPTIKC